MTSTRINACPVRTWIGDLYPGSSDNFVADTENYRYDGPSIVATLPAAGEYDGAALLLAVSYDPDFGTFEGYDISGLEWDYKLDFDPGDPTDPDGCGLKITIVEVAPSTSEIWEVDRGGATGGTFDIGIVGDMRTLDFDATPAEIIAELNDVFGSGYVAGTGYFNITINYRLGDSGLQADFTALTGDTGPSLYKSQAYDADTPSIPTVYADYIYTPCDWTTFSWSSGALGRAEYMAVVELGRDGAYDVSAWIDNVELAPTFEISGAMFPLEGQYNIIPTGAFEADGVMGYGPTAANIPVTEFEFTGYGPATQWALPRGVSKKLIYTLTLTGAEDSTTDIDLPMTSFQSRVRAGERSYLAAIVPNSTLYADLIADRPNGQLVIKAGYEFSDGSRQLQEIVRGEFEDLRTDRRPNSDSATLTAGKTWPENDSPIERTLAGVTYVSLQADGATRVRCAIDFFLRPGDTAIYGRNVGESMTVDYISYQVQASPPSASMEVTSG